MNDPSPDLIKDVEIHQKLNEKQLSYEELFHQLDKNNDGRIDAHELIELLEKLGMETTTQNRAAIARVSCYFLLFEISIEDCLFS
jgi:Ca2+-binding EF-hand superfamily protein